jgi:hypothetical protein
MSNSNSNPTVVNCVFADNSAGYAGGMCNDHLSFPTLVNCTFSGNSADLGGGIANGNSVPTLTNCILWGNTDAGGSGESAQIYIDGDPPVLNYSCVQGWTGDLGGIGNIGDDPLFVPGPAGCHYLSQITAGHAVDSPCVDAGSDSAANLGLDTLTTRSDEGVDAGTADMGYHYPVTGGPLIMGDFDRDGRVTLADVAELQNCFTGDGPAAVSPCCRIFDFEPDEDVDLDDYALFRWALSGPVPGG